MSEYKPGALVSAFVPTRSRRHVLVHVGADDWPWRILDSDFGTVLALANGIGADNVTDIRPLVVIDPEDREQVERLSVALGGDHYYGSTGILQAALREFANPKPPEPTGLGAVVEDARGVRWVRTESAKGITNPWSAALHEKEPDTVRQFAYVDINVVKVLSEGVAR
jgi:hypothetical protein